MIGENLSFRIVYFLPAFVEKLSISFTKLAFCLVIPN